MVRVRVRLGLGTGLGQGLELNFQIFLLYGSTCIDSQNVSNKGQYQINQS